MDIIQALEILRKNTFRTFGLLNNTHLTVNGVEVHSLPRQSVYICLSCITVDRLCKSSV